MGIKIKFVLFINNKYMYKTIKNLAFLTILLSSSVAISESNIKEICSVKESLDVLNKTNEKSLVLFDVDEVLIYPTDRLLIPKFHLNDSIKTLKREFEKKKGKEIFNVWSNVLLQAKRVLIEPDCIINIINSMQKRNVKVLGLTKLRVGKYGKIPSLEEHRFNHLIGLGIDFRVGFYKT